MALCKDYRVYHNEQPLRDALDFVVLNFHNLRMLGCSYLKSNKLLEFYICRHDLIASTVARYNNTYLILHDNDVDGLCRRIYDIRSSFKHEGLGVFNTGIHLYNYALEAEMC